MEKQEHSIKVPRLYKVAANILKRYFKAEGNIKTLIYEFRKKHPNVKALNALVSETVKNKDIIEDIFTQSNFLTKENKMNKDLSFILTTELLWGKKYLPGSSLPIQTILKYEALFNDLLRNSKFEMLLDESLYKPRYVRVNTLKITMESVLQVFSEENYFEKIYSVETFKSTISSIKTNQFCRDIHISNLLIFPPKTPFYDHPLYTNGCLFLQDKSSCFPVAALDLPQKAVILDACAAPGMKTTQLASICFKGKIIAVERNERRFETLKQMVQTAGAEKKVKLIHADFLSLNPQDFPDVQYIVLDPSCSGSGMNKYQEANDDRLRKLSNLQKQMLRHATHFPNVIKISYSTCSIYEEENEQVVNEILENTRGKREFSPVCVLPSWHRRGNEKYKGSECYLRANSSEDLCTGFFVAVLERIRE